MACWHGVSVVVGIKGSKFANKCISLPRFVVVVRIIIIVILRHIMNVHRVCKNPNERKTDRQQGLNDFAGLWLWTVAGCRDHGH